LYIFAKNKILNYTQTFNNIIMTSDKFNIIEYIIKNMVFIEGQPCKMQLKLTEETTGSVDTIFNMPSFYMAKYPVTILEWSFIMNDETTVNADTLLPKTNVSWKECQVFIQKLNSKSELAFRMPTESEWEYAALGGIRAERYQYAGSNDVEEVAWYREENNDGIHRVGLKKSGSSDKSCDFIIMQIEKS
jgi:formylglycine-generating enzyme required for sulfatase activity